MHYSHGHLWFFVPFVWSLLHWIKSFSLASWQMSKWFLIAVWFTGWNFINFPVTFKKKCSSISYLTHCILLELYFLNSKLFYFTLSKVCSISLLNCNSKICSNIIEVNNEKCADSTSKKILPRTQTKNPIMNEMMPIFHRECNFVVLLHFERFEILITVWELHNGIPDCPRGSLPTVRSVGHKSWIFYLSKKTSLQKLTKHGCIRYDPI